VWSGWRPARARELEALGHRPRIIAPEYARPFRLSGFCAAVRQSQVRFVAQKRAGRQARLAVHRLRQDWQEERIADRDRLRGLLSEFGRVYPNGAAAARSDLQVAMNAEPGQRNRLAALGCSPSFVDAIRLACSGKSMRGGRPRRSHRYGDENRYRPDRDFQPAWKTVRNTPASPSMEKASLKTPVPVALHSATAA
jgi:hypothetical protein